MNPKRRFSAALFLLLFFFSAPLHADRASLSIQAFVVDKSTGKALDGFLTCRFSVYNSKTSGEALFNESQTVEFNEGVFSAAILVPTDVITENESLFLGVAIGGDSELSPRLEYFATPYSVLANRADSAAEADVATTALNLSGENLSNILGSGLIASGGTIRLNTGASQTWTAAQTYNSQTLFAFDPVDTTSASAVVRINPTTSNLGDKFLAVQDNGTDRFTVDKSGNVVISGNLTIDGGSVTGVGDVTGVTAASGLTGGGTIGEVTLSVGAGNAITVNADDVAVATNSINQDELAAAIALADADLFDLSAILHDDAVNQGIKLPQGAVLPTNLTNSGEGHLYWKTDTDTLHIFDGANWVAVSNPFSSSISSSEIVDETIVAADIATGAVTTAEILDGTIVAADIAAGAITATGIAAGTITTTEIAADTIAAVDIATDAVGTLEIAPDAVTTAEIAPDTIAAADIATGAVGTAEIADGVVSTDDIALDTIAAADIATGAVTTTEILDATIAAVDIAAGTITTTEIAADTIAAADIAANAVGDSELDTSVALTWTANQTVQKADPSLIFDVVTALDTDFWIGVTDDAQGDDDDLFQIGDGTTPGTNPFITVDTSGNVGIGATPAGGKVDINSGILRIRGGTGEFQAWADATPTSAFRIQALSTGMNIDTFDGTWRTGRLFIDDGTGNVGIGTVNPGQKLTVDGTFGILEGGGTPSFHTILQGGDQAADLTYTLPTAAPTASGQVLSSTTAGVMSWASTSANDAPVGAEYIVSALDGTLTNEDLMTAGSGLTGTNAAGTFTLDVGAGTGLTVAADTIGITADGINFTELADALALDASTSITADAAEVLTITNTGTGNSLVVEDVASDTTPFVIDASGNVGIGTATPAVTLDITGDLTVSNGDINLTRNSSATSVEIAQVGTGKILELWDGAIATGTAVLTVLDGGNVGIGVASPAGKLVFDIPAAETIAAGATITVDGCGTVKMITAAGVVTTNTTDTFTAPAAANEGCCMRVINTGANAITLDANANFKTAGGTDKALGQFDVVEVCSTGASGAWYQVAAVIDNS